MDYDFDHIKHSELAQRYKNGANWFYWIAGLTIVTSLIAFGGGGIRFLISLGSTQLIDGIAEVLAPRLGGAVKVVALVLDLVVTALFVLFGWLANKKHLWAYILGMVAFGLDGLVNLMAADVIGVVAHVVILFFLVRGFLAGREMVSLEKSIADQAAQQAQPAV
jgi:hypothetical protein